MNPKVVEESTHVHTKVVANAGVNPRHVLNTRVVRKDIIVVGDLKAESNAKFVFLMTPIDHIRESYFSRVFFKETRNLLINSGFVSDQMRDHFYRNLQKLHEETGIDLNKPLSNEDYDLLHESTIYPNGWVFGSLSPYAISAFARCDELNLHDQEHSFENFRSWEVLKYKGLVETLSVFDTLLERLICEDQAHKAFERTEDDYSIVEYFQYLYNLYHSEAFDWCRGMICVSPKIKQFDVSPLILDYFGKLGSDDVVSAHGWRKDFGLRSERNHHLPDVHFYSSENKEARSRAEPTFTLKYRQEAQMDMNKKRYLLSSLPQYSSFYNKKDWKWNTIDQERTLHDRFENYPHKNTCFIKDKENLKKNITQQLRIEMDLITNSPKPEERDRDTLLKIKIRSFLNRYYEVLKTQFLTTFEKTGAIVDTRDPLFCQATFQEPGEIMRYDQNFYMPGGKNEQFKSDMNDLSYLRMAYMINALAAAFGSIEKLADFLAHDMVFAGYNSSCRQNYDGAEGVSIFESKMSDYVTFTRMFRNVLKERWYEAHEGRFPGMDVYQILTEQLFEYYEKGHCVEDIDRSRQDMLEENDYMFFAYLNDIYHKNIQEIFGVSSSSMTSLVKLGLGGRTTTCMTTQELDYDALIEPLLDVNVSDIVVNRILTTMEKNFSDAKILTIVAQQEWAIEQLRQKLNGPSLITDTMPMIIPPLPRVCNRVGGYLCTTQYNQQLFDNITRTKIDNYYSDQRVDNYYGVPTVPAMDLRYENQMHIAIEDVPYKINSAVREVHEKLRKRFVDRGIWNDKIRTGNYYLPYPFFSKNMLQRFVQQEGEIMEQQAFQNKYQHDPVYVESKAGWKEIMDNYFIKGSCLNHISQGEKVARAVSLRAMHRWSLGNNQSDNGLQFRTENTYNYLGQYNQNWMVQFSDFRGRLYGYGIWNPTGTKLNRALIKFSRGAIVDERAKYWLYVHMANSAGWNDKESNDVRYETTKEKEDFIKLVASDPITHIDKWEELDNPWQSLAAIMEIDALLKAEEKGEEFNCSLPIFQDGSCNGLQHYAAIARDPLVGSLVNLFPGSKPTDIYSVVLNRLKEVVLPELDTGRHAIPDHLVSEVRKLLTRSIVKRPIMTLPYGSVGFGWEQQIKEEMIKMMTKGEIQLQVFDLNTIAKYLRIKLDSVMQNTLETVVQTQKWLNHLITQLNSSNIPVRWRNPNGMPLALRNFTYCTGKEKLERHLPWKLIDLNQNDPEAMNVFNAFTQFEFVTNGRKNLSSLSPNIIHSLDAAHLKLTAYDYRIQDPSRSWLSVHDSFGTTVTDIDAFSKNIRKTFVEIYDTDIRDQFIYDCMETTMDQKRRMFELLDKLAAAGVFEKHEGTENRLIEHYDKILNQLNTKPPKGQLDMEMVNQSRYFFS